MSMMSTLQKSVQKMSHDSKSNGFGILARKFKLMPQTSIFPGLHYFIVWDFCSLLGHCVWPGVIY